MTFLDTYVRSSSSFSSLDVVECVELTRGFDTTPAQSEVVLDHNNVKELFGRYVKATSNDEKATLVNTSSSISLFSASSSSLRSLPSLSVDYLCSCAFSSFLHPSFDAFLTFSLFSSLAFSSPP
jgi:hypothetical protein